MERIYLSPPEIGFHERESLRDALESNWIAPLGPHVDAFEAEMASRVGVSAAVALSSGTAALHLALLVLGVDRTHEVITSSMTFAATANAIAYVGARPVFIDVSPSTWTLDPELLASELSQRDKEGQLPRAVVTVDLYGQCADYERITSVCGRCTSSE